MVRSRQPGQVRPGGRTARTTAAVYDAVRALVTETAESPTIAQVAERAGVNPTTLYRRWGSREALLLEVAVDGLNERSPLRSSGDLRSDLEAYGRGILRGLRAPGRRPLLSAIVAAANSPDVGVEATMVLVGRRLELVRQLLTGSGCGAALTPMDVIDGLVGPLYFRALVAESDGLQDTDVVRMVDNLVAVAAHRQRSGVRFPEAEAWPDPTAIG